MQESTSSQQQHYPVVNQRQELRDVLSNFIPGAQPRKLESFKDILSDRADYGDLMWVSREWNPTPVSQHASKRSPAKIRQDVMGSPRMQHVIEELSEEKGIPQEQLWMELHDILHEMGQTQTMPVVRWFGFALSKIMKRIYKGVHVNEESIDRLRASIGDNPVIFMPSHRSYADFLLMSYVCFHYNIMLPVIAAGMDFVAMWGVGRLLRDSGAFFIRRSFGNDRLYWAAFSEYVQTLITAGDAPVEFFVEGTRSRTAKSLCPKLGLLSVALEPFFTGQVSDIMVVPINISYDRTLEETLYSYELLGVPKPKESTSGLFKALQVLDEQYGRIHVDFSRPISIRQFCGDLRCVRLLRPLHLQYQPGPEEAARIVRLAHYVVRQQQQHAVLSTFSLAAVILTNHMLSNKNQAPIQLHELTKEVAWLRSVIETLGALVDVRGDIESSVKEAVHVHKSLVQLTPNNAVQLKSVHSPQKSVDPKKLRGHNLTSRSLEVGVPMVMLQHYVNQTLHLLVCPAIVTLALQHSVTQGHAKKDDVFAKYQFLRSILSHEFILHKAWEDMDFEDALKQLDLLHIVEETAPGRLVLGNHRKLQQLLVHLLHPFLSGYFVCCQALSQMGVNAPVTLPQILQSSQQKVEQQLLSGELMHHYSLSLDLLSAAVSAFNTMGAVTRTKDAAGKVMYQADADKLRQISSTLGGLMKQAPEPATISQESVADQLLVQERAKL